MRVLARAAIAVAALVAISLTLADARSGEAHHLCGATGSPFGPFDIETYEAGDYRAVYAQTLELAGANQLFPSIESFAVPKLDSGARGDTTQVNPVIPPVLLKAIANIESSWAQADYSVPYGSVGAVLSSHDCGYGIMQITSGMQNISGGPTLDQAMIGGHFAFNIARGANILADKWNMAPELRPQVGNADPRVMENWYFALWGYNGFAFQNHPYNPAFSQQRVDFSCGPPNDGFGHDRTRYPYQELVFGCVEHPPIRGGAPLWPAQNVQMPDLSDPDFANPLKIDNWNACSHSANCAPMDIPTPEGASATPTADEPDGTSTPTESADDGDVTPTPAANGDGDAEAASTRTEVLGTPKIEVATSSLSLGRKDRATVSVGNSGTGVLAYRVRTSAPFIKVSPSQGVALGSDIGVRSSSFVVEANTAGLSAGIHRGEIVIESLHTSGGPKTISVTITNQPTSGLIAGSGPRVYAVKSGLKRWIPNPATLEANGYSFAGIEKIPDTMLSSIPEGDPLFDVLSDANLIAGGGPAVYVMQGGLKRHVMSRAVMSACGFSFDDIERVSSGRVNAIPTGEPLTSAPCPRPAIPSGRLVSGTGHAIYVISQGLKRHIPDGASLEGLGYRWGNIDEIGDSMLNVIPTGNKLLSVLADGNVVRGSGDALYIMQGGQRRPGNINVLSQCGYSGDAVRVISNGRLSQIPLGPELTASPCPGVVVPNGALVSAGGPAVYVIENGQMRHIASRAALEGCGYRWGDIDVLPASMAAVIPQGATLHGPPCP